MEFVVIGDVGGVDTYHVGDEAMLEANLAAMRRFLPGARFTVVSKDPQWTSNYYHVESVQALGFPEPESGDWRLRETLLAEATRIPDTTPTANVAINLGNLEQIRWASEGSAGHSIGEFRERCQRLLVPLRRSSGLIISGGGNLCSIWPHYLCERVALIFMAHQLGKPIAVLGQTLGPRLEPREHNLLASALRVADIVVVREKPSYELALAMGVERSRLLYSLDDAFYLEEQALAAPFTEPAITPASKPWVAVTLTAFLDPQRESAGLRSLADQLTRIHDRTAANLAFIPHAGEAPGTPPDQVMGTRLAARLDGALPVFNLHVAPEVRWLTRQASMIISNRYHPVVFGLASGVPCLGLYSDEYTRVKIRGALAHAELTEWAISIEEALQGRLASQALQLWQERDRVRSRLRSKQAGWREQDKLRWSRVLEAIGVGQRRAEDSLRAPRCV